VPKTVLKTIHEQTNQFRQRSRTTDYRKRYWGNKQDGKKTLLPEKWPQYTNKLLFFFLFFLFQQDIFPRLSDHSLPGDSEMHE